MAAARRRSRKRPIETVQDVEILLDAMPVRGSSMVFEIHDAGETEFSVGQTGAVPVSDPETDPEPQSQPEPQPQPSRSLSPNRNPSPNQSRNPNQSRSLSRNPIRLSRSSTMTPAS